MRSTELKLFDLSQVNFFENDLEEAQKTHNHEFNSEFFEFPHLE